MSQNNENISELCRICLNKSKLMYQITEMDKLGLDSLDFPLNFKLTETFTSLTTLCEDCTKKLEGFTSLIQIAKRTQLYLESVQYDISNFSPLKNNVQNESQVQLLSDITYDEVMASIKEAKTIFYSNLNCISCNFLGINRKGLISHVSIVHKELKTKWCSICNKLTPNLDHHKKENHSKGDLCCKFCKKNFILNEHLIKHLLHHLCSNNKNNDQKDISIDMESEVPREKVQSESQLCNFCGKVFETHSKLKIHLKSHSNEKPFICTFCNKRLKTRSNLKQHENIHRECRRYVCNICGKTFNQSSTLRTHLKLHGDKDQSCRLCSKTFCRLADLKTHLRTHTGEKPFQCGTCKIRFIQKSHLTEHEKLHFDVKPFKCSICLKSFAQKSTLKSHLDIHLGIKKYKCKYCSYSARQSYVLKTHLKQHEELYNFE
ncbi:zinc finger protein 558-like [Onthophagus taurus]|uniref:zinc finger protein 558-like n=1 Tax=Onthophagus taurus TaxID=166361 RepID=UPI0039BE7DD4